MTIPLPVLTEAQIHDLPLTFGAHLQATGRGVSTVYNYCRLMQGLYASGRLVATTEDLVAYAGTLTLSNQTVFWPAWRAYAEYLLKTRGIEVPAAPAKASRLPAKSDWAPGELEEALYILTGGGYAIKHRKKPLTPEKLCSFGWHNLRRDAAGYMAFATGYGWYIPAAWEWRALNVLIRIANAGKPAHAHVPMCPVNPDDIRKLMNKTDKWLKQNPEKAATFGHRWDGVPVTFPETAFKPEEVIRIDPALPTMAVEALKKREAEAPKEKSESQKVFEEAQARVREESYQKLREEAAAQAAANPPPEPEV